jgi:hypothetical protein
MVDMTPANSQVYDSGSLSATASALSFKFASYLDLSGLVLFQMGTIGDFGPFWCATNADSAGPCYGETFPAIGVSTQQGDSPIEQLGLVGETVIATVVPEPSTWAMLALGFGGLGFACYRSRKFSAAA